MTICNKCKIELSIDHFKIKRDGSYTKTCDVCRGYAKTARDKNMCIHKKQKYQCVKCDGSSICIHKRNKSKCKQCDGSQICIHKKDKPHCKKCTDPIKVTVKYMIHNSKKEDIKYNRYNESQHIDRAFCENLLKTVTHCPYDDCKIRLQCKIYDSTMASIERIDNSIGHIKSNCTICCLSCNKQRKSNHQSPTFKVSDGGSSTASSTD